MGPPPFHVYDPNFATRANEMFIVNIYSNDYLKQKHGGNPLGQVASPLALFCPLN